MAEPIKIPTAGTVLTPGIAAATLFGHVGNHNIRGRRAEAAVSKNMPTRDI